jgi:hypothetical protein
VLLTPASASSGRRKQYVLTAVADIGTVYWRYDCVHYRSPEWSLGIRFWGKATTTAVYRAGRLTRRRTLPANTIWFPFRRNRRQSLSFVQAIEPGSLRARVTTDWRGGSHCESYFPPRVSMQLYPRG